MAKVGPGTAIRCYCEELRPYQEEAFNDEESVRVIIWPRRSGKSGFVAMETQCLAAQQGYSVIINPSVEEVYRMGHWLKEVNPKYYTNLTLQRLKEKGTLAQVVKRAGGRPVSIFFHEPDLCADCHGDRELISTLITELCQREGEVHMTYIGTVSLAEHNGSRLTRMSRAVPYIHTAHPREVYGHRWRQIQREMLLLGDVVFNSQYAFHATASG